MPDIPPDPVLMDRLWELARPLLPPKPAQPKGGRPFADDRACFEGVVYVLRTGTRWNDVPRCYPSGVTCWRRHREWTRSGAWDRVWALVQAELAAAAGA